MELSIDNLREIFLTSNPNRFEIKKQKRKYKIVGWKRGGGYAALMKNGGSERI